MRARRIDLVAACAAGLTAAVIVVYVWILRSQSEQPAGWFLVVLSAAAIASGYSAYRGSPLRRPALMITGVVLLGAGVLAILSIGLLILAAGALCVVAAARSPGVGRRRDPALPKDGPP